MIDDDDTFLKQMRGVTPIKKNNRATKEKTTTKYSNKNKETEIIKNTPTTSGREKNIKKSEFELQNLNIKKNIKKGSFKIDKKIDFHGKTLFDSEQLFSESVVRSYNHGKRCLLFVTGKGLFRLKEHGGFEKPKLYNSIIRSSLTNWVKSKKFSKYILSYEPASIEHGGDGAFYVYLRKKKN